MIEVRARRVCLLETQAGGREKGVSAEVFQRGLSFWEAGLWDKILRLSPQGAEGCRGFPFCEVMTASWFFL